PPPGEWDRPVQRGPATGPGRPLPRREQARRDHEPDPAEVRPAVSAGLPGTQLPHPAAAAAPDTDAATASTDPRALRRGAVARAPPPERTRFSSRAPRGRGRRGRRPSPAAGH